jgi:hypothetical protein
MSDWGGVGWDKDRQGYFLVFSYKALDEHKDGVISETAKELEDVYGHKVYYEVRDMKPGAAFETQFMAEVRKCDGGVCFVSKDYANSQYTNIEWKILGNRAVMKGPNRRIAVLLDPIPALQASAAEGMLTANPVCGPMDFDISANNIQWLLGGAACRDAKKIAQQIHKYITGTYVKSEACALAEAAPIQIQGGLGLPHIP